MIVVDSSSIISLAVNCLTPILKLMKTDFIVTPHVYKEIISKPRESKRFAFESLRIGKLFDAGIMKVLECRTDLVDQILHEANTIYSVRGKPLKIIHRAETEALALAGEMNADALLMDERTTRLLLENPHRLKKLLSHRNKSKVSLNEEKLNHLKSILPEVPVIRSTDLIAVAYEKGFLKPYGGDDIQVLDAALTALKLSGCSISWTELQEYKKNVM